MKFDLNKKKVDNTYEFNISGNKKTFDYQYFVLVKDYNDRKSVKILVDVDSFTKAITTSSGTSYNPEKIYSSANSFAKDVKDMEDSARDYLWFDTNKDVNKLVLQQIRKYNYTGFMWNQVAGEIDEGISSYLINSKKGYLNFYGDVYLKDSTTGGKVDIPHFAATLNALLHNTSEVMEFAASFVGGGGSKEQVNDLAGWAGDLQSLIYNLQGKLSQYNSTDYGRAYSETSKLVGASYTKFDQSDMLADVDAVNISAHLSGNNGSLSDNLKGYYNNIYDGTKVSSRYTSFLQNQFGTTDKEAIRSYVGDYLYKDSLNYLLNSNRYVEYEGAKPYEITDAHRRALRDALVNYIYNVNSER